MNLCKCKIFGCNKVRRCNTYDMLYIYPSNFLTEKVMLNLKHQLNNASPPNHQTHKCALGLVLLVISIINNLCAKYDTILTLPIE